MAGYQRCFLGQLLQFVDDPLPDRWLEFDAYLSLLAHGVGVDAFRLRELAGRFAVGRPAEERAAADVAGQLRFTQTLHLEGVMTAPSERQEPGMAIKLLTTTPEAG
jgi:hypothetical protein